VASVNGGITPPPKIRRNTPEEWNSRSIAHFAISTRPIRKHGSEGQKAKGKEQKAKRKQQTTNSKLLRRGVFVFDVCRLLFL
jgi:hypothetical protein